MTNKTICEYCGKEIKTKKQVVIAIYTCETGTANYPNGTIDEKNLYWDDCCVPCKNKLIKGKKIKC